MGNSISQIPNIFLVVQLAIFGLFGLVYILLGLKRGFTKSIWKLFATLVIFTMVIVFINLINFQSIITADFLQNIVTTINNSTITDYYNQIVEADAIPMALAIIELVVKIVLFIVLALLLRGLISLLVFSIPWHLFVKGLLPEGKKNKALGALVGLVQGLVSAAILIFPLSVLINTIVGDGLEVEDPEYVEYAEALNKTNELNFLNVINGIKFGETGLVDLLFDATFSSNVEGQGEIYWRSELKMIAQTGETAIPEIVKILNGEEIENFTQADIVRYEGVFTSFANSKLLQYALKPGVKFAMNMMAEDSADALIKKSNVKELMAKINGYDIDLEKDFKNIYQTVFKLLEVRDLNGWEAIFADPTLFANLTVKEQVLFTEALTSLFSLDLLQLGDVAVEIALESKQLKDLMVWADTPSKKAEVSTKVLKYVKQFEGSFLKNTLGDLVSLIDNTVFKFPGIDTDGDGKTDITLADFIGNLSDFTVILNSDKNYHTWLQSSLQQLGGLDIFTVALDPLLDFAVYQISQGALSTWTQEEIDLLTLTILSNFSDTEDLQRELLWLTDVYREVANLGFAQNLSDGIELTILVDEILGTKEGRDQFRLTMSKIMEGQLISDLTSKMSKTIISKYITEPLALAEPLLQASAVKNFDLFKEVDLAVDVILDLYAEGLSLESVVSGESDMLAELLPVVAGFINESSNFDKLLSSNILYAFIDYNVKSLEAFPLPENAFNKDGEFKDWVKLSEIRTILNVVKGVFAEAKTQELDFAGILSLELPEMLDQLAPVLIDYISVQANEDLLLSSNILYYTISDQLQKFEGLEVPIQALVNEGEYMGWIKQEEITVALDVVKGLYAELEIENVKIGSILGSEEVEDIYDMLLPVLAKFLDKEANKDLVLQSTIAYSLISDIILSQEFIEIPLMVTVPIASNISTNEKGNIFAGWVLKSEIRALLDIVSPLLMEVYESGVKVSDIINNLEETGALVDLILPVISNYLQNEENLDRIFDSEIVYHLASTQLANIDLIEVPKTVVETNGRYYNLIKRSELESILDLGASLVKHAVDGNINIENILADTSQDALVNELIDIVASFIRDPEMTDLVMASDILYVTATKMLLDQNLFDLPAIAYENDPLNPFYGLIRRDELKNLLRVVSVVFHHLNEENISAKQVYDLAMEETIDINEIITLVYPAVYEFLRLEDNLDLLLASDVGYYLASTMVTDLDIIKIPTMSLISDKNSIYYNLIERSEFKIVLQLVSEVLYEANQLNVNISEVASFEDIDDLISLLGPSVINFIQNSENIDLLLSSDIAYYNASELILDQDLITIPELALRLDQSEYRRWIKVSEIRTLLDVVINLVTAVESHNITVSDVLSDLNIGSLADLLASPVVTFLLNNDYVNRIFDSEIIYNLVNEVAFNQDIIEIPSQILVKQELNPYRGKIEKSELPILVNIVAKILEQAINDDVTPSALIDNLDIETIVNEVGQSVVNFLLNSENLDLVMSSNILYTVLSEQLVKLDIIDIPRVAFESNPNSIYQGLIKRSEFRTVLEVVRQLLQHITDDGITATEIYYQMGLDNLNGFTLDIDVAVSLLGDALASFLRDETTSEIILSSDIAYYFASEFLLKNNLVEIPQQALNDTTTPDYYEWIKREEFKTVFDVISALLTQLHNDQVSVKTIYNSVDDLENLVDILLGSVHEFLRDDQNLNLILNSSIAYATASNLVQEIEFLGVPNGALVTDRSNIHYGFIKKEEFVKAVDIVVSLLDTLKEHNVDVSQFISNYSLDNLITKLAVPVIDFITNVNNLDLILASDIIYGTASKQLLALDMITVPQSAREVQTHRYEGLIKRSEIRLLVDIVLSLVNHLEENDMNLNELNSSSTVDEIIEVVLKEAGSAVLSYFADRTNLDFIASSEILYANASVQLTNQEFVEVPFMVLDEQGYVKRSEMNKLIDIVHALVNHVYVSNVDLGEIYDDLSIDNIIDSLGEVGASFLRNQVNLDLIIQSDIVYVFASQQLLNIELLNIPQAAKVRGTDYNGLVIRSEFEAVLKVLQSLLVQLHEDNVTVSQVYNDLSVEGLVNTLYDSVFTYLSDSQNVELFFDSVIVNATVTELVTEFEFLGIPAAAYVNDQTSLFNGLIKKSELVNLVEIVVAFLGEVNEAEVSIRALVNDLSMDNLIDKLAPVAINFIIKPENIDYVLASDIIYGTASKQLLALDMISVPQTAKEVQTHRYEGLVKRSEIRILVDIVASLVEHLDLNNVEVSDVLDLIEDLSVENILENYGQIGLGYLAQRTNLDLMISSEIIYANASDLITNQEFVEVPFLVLEENGNVKRSEINKLLDVVHALISHVEAQNLDLVAIYSDLTVEGLIDSLGEVGASFLRNQDNLDLIIQSDLVYAVASQELLDINTIKVPSRAIVRDGSVYNGMILRSEFETVLKVLQSLLEQLHTDNVTVSQVYNDLTLTGLVENLYDSVFAYISTNSNIDLVLESVILNATVTDLLENVSIVGIPEAAYVSDQTSNFNGLIKPSELVKLVDVVVAMLTEVNEANVSISALVNDLTMDNLIDKLAPVVVEFIKDSANVDLILASDIIYGTASKQLLALDMISVPQTAKEVQTHRYEGLVKRSEVRLLVDVVISLLDQVEADGIDVLDIYQDYSVDGLVNLLGETLVNYIMDSSNTDLILSSDIVYATIDGQLRNINQIEIPDQALETSGDYDGYVKRGELTKVVNILVSILNQVRLDNIKVVDIYADLEIEALIDLLLPTMTTYLQDETNIDLILASEISYASLSKILLNQDIIEIPSVAIDNSSLSIYLGYIKRQELRNVFVAVSGLLETIEDEGVDIMELLDSDDMITELLPVIITFTKDQTNKDNLLASDILYFLISSQLKDLEALQVPDAALVSDANSGYDTWIERTELDLVFTILAALVEEMDLQGMDISVLLDGGDDMVNQLFPVIKAYAEVPENRTDLVTSKIFHFILSDAILGLDALVVPTDALDNDQTSSTNGWIKGTELDLLLQAIIELDIDLPEGGSLDLGSISVQAIDDAARLGSLILRKTISKQLVDADIVDIPSKAFELNDQEMLKQTELEALTAMLIDLGIDLSILDGGSTDTLLDDVLVKNLVSVRYQDSYVVKAFVSFGIVSGLGDLHKLAQDADYESILSETEIAALFAILGKLSKDEKPDETMSVKQLMDILEPEVLTFNQVKTLLHTADSITVRSLISSNILDVQMIKELVIPALAYDQNPDGSDLLSYVEVKALISALSKLTNNQNDKLMNMVDTLDVDTLIMGNVVLMIEEESEVVRVLISKNIKDVDGMVIHPTALDSNNQIKQAELADMMSALSEVLGSETQISSLDTLGDTIKLQQLEDLVNQGSIILEAFMTSTIMDAIGDEYRRDAAFKAEDSLIFTSTEFNAIFDGLGSLDNPAAPKAVKQLADSLDNLTLNQVDGLVAAGSHILRARISVVLVDALEEEKVHPHAFDSSTGAGSKDLNQEDLEELFDALLVLGNNVLVDDLSDIIENNLTLNLVISMRLKGSIIFEGLISKAIVEALGVDARIKDGAYHSIDDVKLGVGPESFNLLSSTEITKLLAALTHLGSSESTIQALVEDLEPSGLNLSVVSNMHYEGSIILGTMISDAFIEVLPESDVPHEVIEDDQIKVSELDKIIDTLVGIVGNTVVVSDIMSVLNAESLKPSDLSIIGSEYSFILVRMVSNILNDALANDPQNPGTTINIPLDALNQDDRPLEIKAEEFENLANALTAIGLVTLELGDFKPATTAMANLEAAASQNSIIVNRLMSEAVISANLHSDESVLPNGLDIQNEELINLFEALRRFGIATIDDAKNIDAANLRNGISQVDDDIFARLIGLVTPAVAEDEGMTMVSEFLKERLTTPTYPITERQELVDLKAFLDS